MELSDYLKSIIVTEVVNVELLHVYLDLVSKKEGKRMDLFEKAHESEYPLMHEYMNNRYRILNPLCLIISKDKFGDRIAQ